MKYQPPFGSSDPNASYVNGNPATGQEGSIPPASMMEEPQREIVSAIGVAGLNPTDGDLTQLAQAMSIGVFVGAFTGTANALTATLPGSVVFGALQAGMLFSGFVGASPNTAAATLNMTGFANPPGAKSILRKDGSAISAGDLPAFSLVSLRYDGTAFRIVGMAASDVLNVIIQNSPRIVVGNPTIWVRIDGNDANDGSANTPAAALLTLSAALALAARYFVPGGQVNIRLGAPGTYAAASPARGSATPIAIIGDQANQGSYVISGAGTAGAQGVITVQGASVTFQGVTLNSSANTTNLLAVPYGGQVVLSNVTFTAAVGFAKAMMLISAGGTVDVGSGGVIVASSAGSFVSLAGGTFTCDTGSTVTFNGGPSFGTTVICLDGFVSIGGSTWSGAVSGTRFAVSANGVINTNGGGPNFIPGSIAGTQATGGQYL